MDPRNIPHGPPGHMELHRIVDDTLQFMLDRCSMQTEVDLQVVEFSPIVGLDTSTDLVWLYDRTHQQRVYASLMDSMMQNVYARPIVIQEGGFQL